MSNQINVSTMDTKKNAKSKRLIKEAELKQKRQLAKTLDKHTAQRNEQNRQDKLTKQQKQRKIVIPHPLAVRCVIEIYLKPGESVSLAKQRAIERALNGGRKKASRNKKKGQKESDKCLEMVAFDDILLQ